MGRWSGRGLRPRVVTAGTHLDRAAARCKSGRSLRSGRELVSLLECVQQHERAECRPEARTDSGSNGDDAAPLDPLQLSTAVQTSSGPCCSAHCSSSIPLMLHSLAKPLAARSPARAVLPPSLHRRSPAPVHRPALLFCGRCDITRVVKLPLGFSPRLSDRLNSSSRTLDRRMLPSGLHLPLVPVVQWAEDACSPPMLLTCHKTTK